MESIINLIILYLIIKFFAKRIKKNNDMPTEINKFSNRYDKGCKGEYKIYKFLNKYININYKIINNVYINKKNGKTTEIDIILICIKGIFVFEIKNYSGWIFGSREQTYWMQRFQNGKTFKFYNPIMQNANHIKALKEYLNIYDMKMFKSIVVFINGKLKTEIEYVKDNYVIANNISIIKDIIELREDIIDENTINEIYVNLKNSTGKSKEEKEMHINNIKNS